MQHMFNESEQGNKMTLRVDNECGEQQEQTRIIPTAALSQDPHFEAKNCRGESIHFEAGVEGLLTEISEGKRQL